MSHEHITLMARAALVRRRRQHAVESAGIVKNEPITLRQFVTAAWPSVEHGKPFIPGWHIDAICDHLEAVTRRDIKRLVINVPPGSMKSLLCNVLWPAWEWGEKDAGHAWMFGTYAAKLATRDSLRMRKLLRSGWYSERYGNRVRIDPKQDTKTRFDTLAGGTRICTSVGASGIGERVNTVVIDDPQTAKQVYTTHRETANNWIKDEMRTRGRTPETFALLIIMQRLHERDATGFVLTEMDGFEHLKIPARYEPKIYVGADGVRHDALKDKPQTSIGWNDPRTEQGEIYWQQMYTEESMTDLEHDLGASATGQLQQRPSKIGGTKVQETWWHFWQPDDIQPLPPVVLTAPNGDKIERRAEIISMRYLHEMLQSWDMSFKDTESSAFVCGQVWAKHRDKPANRYLVDQVREKAGLVKTLKMVASLTERNPEADKKLVEEKANGAAVMDVLKDHIGGFVPVNPEGSKPERLEAVLPQIQGGNCYLPHPTTAEWVTDFITEFNDFPRGQYADQVDTATQALIHLSKRRELGYAPLTAANLLSGLEK